MGSQPPGSIVAYATSAGSVAQDGTGRNGVFTTELLKQIKSPGLEINEVFKRTGKAVSTVSAGKQIPAVYNQFFDSAYLAGSQMALAPSPPVRSQVAPQPAPAPAVSSFVVTRSYGTLAISAASDGTVYIDGVARGELPAGAEASMDNIAVGERLVELRYPSGDKESKTTTVNKGQSSSVAFTWKKAPPLPPALVAAAIPSGFVLVPGGTFTMGSPAGETGRYDNEGPQHQVTLSPFFIGATEVTQAQYKAVMGTNPSNFKGDDLPVETVSWNDAVAYCNKLSEKEGLARVYTIRGSNVTAYWKANGYRLPTEAEWEYAAMGGPGSSDLAVNAVYAGSANANDVAWYSSNASDKTHPVAQKAANSFGIYDMAGNVWEWCWDVYSGYSSGAQNNPTGASSGGDRVGRGGSWDSGVRDLRSSLRGGLDPSGRYGILGFRLARRP